MTPTQVDYSREGKGPVQRKRFCGMELTPGRDSGPACQPERQMAAGRMAQGYDPLEIQMVLRRQLAKIIGRAGDIEESAGPAAGRIADAPIFDIPGRPPGGIERRT